MIRTFVYGTPHGFDFYEKDAAYTEYFKGFYISSRKGRRLMVNRKDNGETSYNYLHYGLREVEVRPNSFFGMTIILYDHQYSPDFNKILEWFDYMFERTLNEKNIFKKNADGEIQYVVNNFDDNPTDVEWIKLNLPKIFSQAAGTTIEDYDDSFIEGRAGQIPCLNDGQSDKLYLSVFRKSYWITLSSEFPKQDETIVSKANEDSGTSIELSYVDLKAQLDDYNKRVVPIATGVNTGSAEELVKMSDNSKFSYNSLITYLQHVTNDDDNNLFENLANDFNSLIESIDVLLSRITESVEQEDGIVITPPEKTQYCYNCKQKKDVSHFRSPSALKCIECEAKEHSGDTLVQCVKCGQYKPRLSFPNEGNICNDCKKEENTQAKICRHCKKKKPLTEFPLNSDICNDCSRSSDWKKLFHNSFIPLLSVILLFAIIGGAYWFISGHENQETPEQNTQQEETTGEETDIVESNKVSASQLKVILDNEDFEAAYKYIEDKDDKNLYISTIVDAIEKNLWVIIENSNSKDAEFIKAELSIRITPLTPLLSNLKLTDNFAKKLFDGANDYARLQTILTKKTQITQTEYNEGKEIVSRIGGHLQGEWGNALESKWEASKVITPASDPSPAQNVNPGPVTLTYTKVDGTEETLTDITGNIGKDAKPGTKVTVQYPNGKIYFEKNKTPFKNSKVITLDPSPKKKMTFTFKCDDVVITITINPPTGPKKH